MADTLIQTQARRNHRSEERVRVTVYLDEPLANWGKQQEGGLSELLRHLLKEAQQEQSQTQDRYPPELRAQYQALIGKKLAQGLSAMEESTLAQIKERINAIDRGTSSRKTMEAAAARVDQELADLRHFIQSKPRKMAP